jgi:hypothetical protein
LIPDESNDLREYFPPLSPLGSSSLDPINTESDDVLNLPTVNSKTPTGAERLIEAECEDIAIISDEIDAIHADGDAITNNILGVCSVLLRDRRIVQDSLGN